MLVDVGDRDLRGTRSRSADTSCAAARLPPPWAKKSSSRLAAVRAEHARPTARPPSRRCPSSRRRRAVVGRRPRQRPRQRVPVDLARGARGQRVDDGEQRDERGGQRVAQLPAVRRARSSSSPGLRHQVADEDLVAARRSGAPRRRPPATPGSACSAASISPSSMRRPPSLTWSSARPMKTRPVGLEAHQVAAAVGALPAERRHGGELLGVLGRVEVAGQPDAADDQLADLALGDRLALAASTTARSQPSSGRPIRTGASPVERARARDDGGLGRAVGVPDLAARRRPAASASSGGQASPPKISSRTASSDSGGHSAASVGTVETTVMPRATSHGPRSMPLRTRDRGAGTRQAPWRQASHISSQDASKATDSPASTRSPGPERVRPAGRAGPRRRRTRPRSGGVTATPFGVPVEPEVKMIQASSGGGRSDSDSASRSRRLVARSGRPAVEGRRRPSASPKTSRARSSRVVDVDRHVGRAGHQHAQDRDVQLDAARRHPHADAVTAGDAGLGERRGHASGLGPELGVAQHHVPVVDRRGVGVHPGGGVEHVDERARLRREESSREHAHRLSLAARHRVPITARPGTGRQV